MKNKIAIVLGSQSDVERLKEGFNAIDAVKVGYTLEVISAHRHPEKLRAFCQSIEKQGIEVVIACAGMAAALPGFIASYVNVPVIGVALQGGLLDGTDALFSMVSTPKGLGLVCSGVGKAAFINALITALSILALKDKTYAQKLKQLKASYR